MNIFEHAVRTKMRFPFKGMITVEDLWDLSLENLDKVFKVLNAQIKQYKEESLLDTKSKEDEMLDTQIQIVKYIVMTKKEERSAQMEAKAKKEHQEKILSVIADKEDEQLKNKSIEELKQLL